MYMDSRCRNEESAGGGEVKERREGHASQREVC